LIVTDIPAASADPLTKAVQFESYAFSDKALSADRWSKLLIGVAIGGYRRLAFFWFASRGLAPGVVPFS
jgi:hypothetical protein